MQQQHFDALVARLERESADSPLTYRLKVAALALLGFALIGMLVGVAGVGLLVLAALAVALLFTGGKALILVAKLAKLGKLLWVVAVPLWMVVRSAVAALFTRLPAPRGIEVRREQMPALFAALDDMRQRMNGPRFHRVLIIDDMNAGVVQWPLFGLVGWPRNYLLLGLPMLEALSPEETLAVVAHEYGHLAGSHSRFASFIYRLRTSWGGIQELSNQWQGWGGKQMQRIVSWYAQYFNAYTFVLARANEYQADAASAELVGAVVAAAALKRFNIAAPRYAEFMRGAFGAVRELAQPPRDLTQRWSMSAREAVPAEQGKRWLDDALQREGHKADTHPVLRERLQALLVGSARPLDELPAPPSGVSAASAWLGAQAASLRAALQTQWEADVAPGWYQRHRQLQQHLDRIREIDAITQPSIDERAERLRLVVTLYPEHDHLVALSLFNAENPGEPSTLYLEACARLAQDDDTGLALLERAIALDIEATLPACEKAHEMLVRTNDARAEEWHARWLQRHEFESARAQQLQVFDETHELRPAWLGADVMHQVRELLAANGQGIRRVYLARRVLPADARAMTYVLGFELGLWSGLLTRRATLAKRLAALEWPMHLFICALDRENRALRKTMKALPGAEIACERER